MRIKIMRIQNMMRIGSKQKGRRSKEKIRKISKKSRLHKKAQAQRVPLKPKNHEPSNYQHDKSTFFHLNAEIKS